MLYDAFLLDHIQVRFYMRTLLLPLLSIVASNRYRRRRCLRLSSLHFCRLQTWDLLGSKANHSDHMPCVEALWHAALEQWHDGSGGSCGRTFQCCFKQCQSRSECVVQEGWQCPAKLLQSQTSIEHGVASLSDQS
jgi:hypothetical protein